MVMLILLVMVGLSNWLINAFNGEWHRVSNPVPKESAWKRLKRSLALVV